MGADGAPYEPAPTETLAGADTAWLRMEDDTNRMTITALVQLDEEVTLDDLAELVRARLLPFRRFRQRVVGRDNPLQRPRWEADPHFALTAHLRHVALPMNGGLPALKGLVGRLMSTPLDYDRPLWQIHLVEVDGRSDTLIFRIHHSIADGFALIYLTLALTDSPGEVKLPVGSVPPPPKAQAGPARRLPSLGDALDLTGDLITRGAHMITHPGEAFALAALGGEIAVSTGHLLALAHEPRTSLHGPLGVAKHAVWSEPLPLERMRRVGRAIGGTLNDALLTAITGALRRYMHVRGDTVDGLDVRAVIPVNLRPLEQRKEPLGNDFGLVFLSLPVGCPTAEGRLALLKQRMDELKRSPEAAVAFAMLASAGLAPLAAQKRLLQLFRGKTSLVITNVPGPREPIHIAGREVRDLMFWVPTSQDIGVGISIFSYCGFVRVGVAADAGLFPYPERLIKAFHDEVRDLLAQERQAAGAPA